MIKKTSEMPLFDERFINFGFNKIEWIETLRYTGYKFAVLINGFGMDVPHPQYVRFDSFFFFRSKFKKDFIRIETSKRDMNQLAKVFIIQIIYYVLS